MSGALVLVLITPVVGVEDHVYLHGLEPFTLDWTVFLLEKAMATHSVLLPGKSHGWRSLVG